MEQLTNRQKLLIMGGVMSAMLFAALNITIVSTSLPKIIAHIGGMSYYSWVFTIYMLTASIISIIVGKLSDIYGRRLFILLGIGIFMLGGLLCGFSTSIVQLILFRGIQGIGGGMIMSSAFATVGDLFSPRERGRWQGLMSSAFGVASLAGPMLGGFIVDHFNWSWVFWVFLPIGFVAFIMIYTLYPTVDRKEKQSIDYIGSTFLAMAIGSLLLGFSFAGNEFAWNSIEVISLFFIFIICASIFIWIETKVENPVIPLHLFKNRIVSTSNIISFLTGIGMFGMIMYIPVYVQGVLGKSATISGVTEMVMTVAMVTCSSFVGYLITKTGTYKRFALIGLAIMAIGLYIHTTLTPTSHFFLLLTYLIIFGAGLGMTMPIFMLTVQNAVDHSYLGVVTATAQLSRQLGGTVGVSVLGTILNMKMTKEIDDGALPSMPMEGGSTEQLYNPSLLMDPDTMLHLKQSLSLSLQPLFDQLLQSLRFALSNALSTVFLFACGFIVLAFLFTLTLEEIPLRETNIPTKSKKQN